MEIKDILTRLRESKEFKEWEKKNNGSFLAHIFKLLDEANQDDWQIGFYNKDDTITSFIINPKEIKIAETENIFKRPEAKIAPLEENKIKIDITKALEIAEKTQVKAYKQEMPGKIITILQKLDMGQVYNITYVTQSFKILNFKIDAANGKVLKTKLENIMDFKAS